MPTQLWCCDYCDFQDESKSSVERHEKNCDCNPIDNFIEAYKYEEEIDEKDIHTPKYGDIE